MFLLSLATEGQKRIIEHIDYTRDQLIALCKSALLCKPALQPGARPEVPKVLRRRRWGCRARAKWKAKKRRHRLALPAIIMGNMRSLGNKMDELAVLIKTQREHRECSVLCFTETWLHSHIPDHSVAVPGFSTVWADRDVISSGKKKGGGIAVYVSERWCNPWHVLVKERLCSPDIERLTVGMRPYYLPREFTSAIFIGMYIPPSADAAVACDDIHSAVAQVQTHHPSAFIVITGDFNHVSLEKTLPIFHQYTDCPTRDYDTLDLMYANAKDAYNPLALTPLGRSDHNLVLLTPENVPLACPHWEREEVTHYRTALSRQTGMYSLSHMGGSWQHDWLHHGIHQVLWTHHHANTDCQAAWRG